MPVYVPNQQSPTRLRRDGWGALLRRWGALLDRYEKLAATWEDVAYWYNERPLTGILAAAAWQIPGGCSLEECPVERGPKLRRRSGRSDACIMTGGTWYYIEAKRRFVSGKAEAAIQHAEDSLQWAVSQLRDLGRSHRTDSRAMALCYVQPCVMGRGVGSADSRWSMYCDEVGEHFKAQGEMLATYEPRGEKAGRWNGKDGSRGQYLGVILVGRQVW